MNDNYSASFPPAKTDIAVLLIFFCREDHFRKVFDEVKKARPSRLLLYQDGPRNEGDKAGIAACRAIAEDIDWQCEVHRFYQEKNMGCDPSGFIAHRWAFSIWGWASWRRVVEKWDEHYTFLNDATTCRQLQGVMKKGHYRKQLFNIFKGHAATGKAYFETIFNAAIMLNSQMAIMPSVNMINNVGFSGESTHYQGSTLDTMPSSLRRIFTMKRQEIAFPLVHPPYVIEEVDYRERMYKVNAWDHPFVKIRYSLEELGKNLVRGNFSIIYKALVNRLRKFYR